MTISQHYREQIALLKKRLQAMLIIRSKMNNGTDANPSPLWSEMVSVSQYLMDLSAENLVNIRFHTGLMNGVSSVYLHNYPPIDPIKEIDSLGYAVMTIGVPKKYWVSEPLAPSIPFVLGVEYQGAIVNPVVARYQNCATILYHSGAFDFIETAQKRQVIVEIGGGHGGLAHCLKESMGSKASYVIVDLPEVLLISGAFLMVNNPNKSIWVYDEKEAEGSGFVEKIMTHDFVLLPNFIAERLLELEDIALMINLQSFQEMTESQITQYLEITKKKVTFGLYTDNQDCHPYNKKLSSIGELLEQRFDLNPPRAFYHDRYEGLDLKSYLCYFKFIAQPKGTIRRASEIPEHLLLPVGFYHNAEVITASQAKEAAAKEQSPPEVAPVITKVEITTPTLKHRLTKAIRAFREAA